MGIQRFLIAVTLALALGLGVITGEAASSARFVDAAGDSMGAPDLTGVTISHTAAGTVSFDIAIANFSALAEDEAVMVVFDADQNQTTGVEGGEYFMVADATMLSGGFAPIVSLADEKLVGMATAQAKTTGVAMTLATKLIGQPSAFSFLLASSKGDSGFDVCGDDFHAYSLAVTATSVQVPKQALTPRAGTMLSVRGTTVKLNTGELVKPTKLVSRLTIGGKLVKPLTGGNAWKIAPAARGKTGVLTVQTWYGTSQKTATFRIKVR
jgi:hypothetical protein